MNDSGLTEKIIGASFEVYNTLGFGFLESVYEKSLIFELNKLGLNVENQKSIQVSYKNHAVGDFIADLMVENRVIIELKSVSKLIDVHEVQLVNYLTATRIDTGLLINFGPREGRYQKKA